jgi:hypothetical protein
MIEFLHRSQDQMLVSPASLLQQQSGNHIGLESPGRE